MEIFILWIQFVMSNILFMDGDPYAFYAALLVCPSFAEVTRPEVYTALPDDWVVVIGDVEGSTAAIARGQYKDVNLVGSSLLVATFNALGHSNLPFVFGGDGATLALPLTELARARPAFLATRRMARDGFDLGLRIGVVPMRDIRAAGHDLRVARVRLSDKFSLAAFWGGGLGWAEKTVKDLQAGECFRIEEYAAPTAETFVGLECRWRGVPSEKGETLSLLIQAMARDDAARVRIYTEVLKKLREIFGDRGDGHPITENQLQIARKLSEYDGETKVQRSQAGALGRAWFRFYIRLVGLLGGWLMRHKITAFKANWGQYKQDTVTNSDYQKFDGVLRMVLSASEAERTQLVDWLHQRYRAGELAYGLHISVEALVTCLIFEREGGHLHFIDGANGGYALAAVDLKSRLTALAEKKGSVMPWFSP
jgi:hypothetical protein